jgi:predicted CoA-binding protein
MTNIIKQFFNSPAYAVVGASKDRYKYGNKVLRCYQQHHKTVWPIHPTETTIEGLPVLNEINKLPSSVKSISIITPPHITEKIVDQAIEHGIQNIWMQPGAESNKAIEQCSKHGITCIANGPCVLVVLGFIEENVG